MASTAAPFRIALQVSDLEKAAAFYAKLLDDDGRRIQRASRHYFDCGSVILALVVHPEVERLPDYIYFALSRTSSRSMRGRSN